MLVTIDPREARDPALAERARAWLSDAELAVVDGIRVAGRREEALTTRVLARFLLGRVTGMPPKEVRIAIDAHGKPRHERVRFNLTNTVRMVVCVLSPDEREVGVDVEGFDRAAAIEEVAHLVFRPEEIARLSSPRDYVELWTAKESYMKARGLGFLLPPLEFSIEAIEGWRFAKIEETSHSIAVCMEKEPFDLPIERLSLGDVLR